MDQWRKAIGRDVTGCCVRRRVEGAEKISSVLAWYTGGEASYHLPWNTSVGGPSGMSLYSLQSLQIAKTSGTSLPPR